MYKARSISLFRGDMLLIKLIKITVPNDHGHKQVSNFVKEAMAISNRVTFS